MKILPSAPEHAVYLGSEHADGSLEEEVFDAIDAAFEPAFYRDGEGVRHYFDLFQD
jgi:hypothetical protein